MCGRFGLGNPERLDGFLYRYAFPGLGAAAPRFNITPSADIPIVLTINGELATSMARWGLVPSWAKDESVGTRLVQARGETVHEKPSYRNALKFRRGLIPADFFYEWQAVSGRKLQQPWCIRFGDNEVFAMGALWEQWLSPNSRDGVPLLSCCIITTASNHSLRHIHDRMPLVLHPSEFQEWLNPKTKPEIVRDMIRPYPLEGLHGYKVSTWVNSPSHNDERCIAPLGDTDVDENAAADDADVPSENAARSKGTTRVPRAQATSEQIDVFGQ